MNISTWKNVIDSTMSKETESRALTVVLFLHKMLEGARKGSPTQP